MNKELLFLGVNSIISAIDYLKEYSNECDNNQKIIILSMLESLKNMGNTLCDIAEEKKNTFLNEMESNISDEVFDFIKEIQEEVKKGKINEQN